MKSRLILIFSIVCSAALAGEPEKARAEDIFFDRTLFAVVMPDFNQAIAKARDTHFATMLKSPEIQEFVSPIIQQLRASYEEVRKKNPLLPAFDDIENGALNGEVAFAVHSREDPAAPHGQILTFAPKNFDLITKTLAPIFGGNLPKEEQAVPLGAGSQVWGHFNGRIIVCSPAADFGIALSRVKAAAPRTKALSSVAGYNQVRGRITSSVGWMYADPRGIMDALLNEPGGAQGFARQFASVISLMKLDSLNALAIGVGFNGGEPIIETAYDVPAEAQKLGIFGLFAPAGVPNKETFKIASANAPYVMSWSMDWQRTIALLRGTLGLLHAGLAAQIDESIAAVNQTAKFDIEKDLFGNIGLQAVACRTDFDTGTPFSNSAGIVSAVPVKNAELMKQVLKQLEENYAAIQKTAPVMASVTLKRVDHKGQTIYYFARQVLGGPALVLVGDHLIYGDSLNAVRRGLDQFAKTENILSNPSFQEVVTRMTGEAFNADKLPTHFAYAIDDGGGGGTFFATAGMLSAATLGLGGIAEMNAPRPMRGRNGGMAGPNPMMMMQEFMGRPIGRIVYSVAQTVDYERWPDESFFAKHRRPKGAILVWGPNGLYARTEFPPPSPAYQQSSLMVLAGVGIVAGLAFPALSKARESARRAASSANLRQVGVACRLYADDPAHGGVYPADPKELMKYIGDPRILTNPRAPGQDGYVYIARSNPELPDCIVMYENVPGPAEERSVLFADGRVEWMQPVDFAFALQETQKTLKRTGLYKEIPVIAEEIGVARPKREAPPQPVPPPIVEAPRDKPPVVATPPVAPQPEVTEKPRAQKPQTPVLTEKGWVLILKDGTQLVGQKLLDGGENQYKLRMADGTEKLIPKKDVDKVINNR